MAVYNDNLEFNSAQLQEQIGILEEIRNTIQSSKDNYVDYINTNLSPNWTTEGGKNTINGLLSFADIDIQGFITYLDGRIQDLEDAKARTVKIDQVG